MLDEREDGILPMHLEVVGNELLIELQAYRMVNGPFKRLSTRYYKCRANTVLIHQLDLQKITQ